MPALTVDGFDVATIGFIVSEVEGHRGGYDLTYPLAEIPVADGVQLLAASGIVPARRITVSGYQRAPDLATLLTRKDELVRRLRARPLALRFGDQPDRYITGYVQSQEVPLIGPHLMQTYHYVRITFLCPDPRWYADAVTTVALSGSATPTPLGSAPVSPVVTITGPATGPQIIVRQGGTEVSRMDFAGASVGGGASLVVDGKALTIRDGNGASRASDLLSGLFPRLAPAPDGTPPTLEIAGGSGSASYRQAWL
jgi:phage-related protein